MTRYTNYNANTTQLLRRRRRNAEHDKYQKNSSKNSEPLLSLLDLSEHKNWGVNFVAFYCSTGCYFIHLSRHIQQTSSFVSSIPRYPRHLLSLSYSVTSRLVCCMQCFGPGCCASSWLDTSAPRVLVTSFLKSFGTSHDPRYDPLWHPHETLPMPKSQAHIYVVPCCL